MIILLKQLLVYNWVSQDLFKSRGQSQGEHKLLIIENYTLFKKKFIINTKIYNNYFWKMNYNYNYDDPSNQKHLNQP